MIRVLIVDDHTIFRDGLANLLSEDPAISVVAKMTNGAEALEFYISNPETVDVIVTDYRMPVMDGLEATEKIMRYDSNAKIVILSMYDDSEFIIDGFVAGAKAFMSKDSEREELFESIHEVSEGRYYFREKQVELLLDRLRKSADPYGTRTEKMAGSGEPFTEREIEILQLMIEEKTSAEIAERLGTSMKTIENHRRNMMHKIGAKNVVGLVVFAARYGMVQMKPPQQK